MQTEEDLRAELAENGEEWFRRTYGPQAAPDLEHVSVTAAKAILAELDRTEEIAHLQAAADRSAKLVGLAEDADDASRRALTRATWSSWVSIAAIFVALMTLIRSCG